MKGEAAYEITGNCKARQMEFFERPEPHLAASSWMIQVKHAGIRADDAPLFQKDWMATPWGSNLLPEWP